MGRSEKSEKKSKSVLGSSPLADGIAAFSRGDFRLARRLLSPKAEDASLGEGQRTQAKELIAATRIELGALYTGLACIGLLVLVIAFAHFIQPTAP